MTAGSPTGINDNRPFPPEAVTLHQNYPNPFNPTTTIGYSITGTNHVTVGVYDITGRLVRTLVDEAKVAGPHSVMWDGRDTNGIVVATGIYFVRLESVGRVATQKIVVLK